MRVLVTGAAGFLGSHLKDRLLSEGHSVVGVDNFSTCDPKKLAHLQREPRFSFEEWDICEPFGLRFDPGRSPSMETVARPAVSAMSTI
jgi:dTDP-glucose 4,6-dehydratase